MLGNLMKQLTLKMFGVSQSGLDKQQCTMQLTVFLDGIPHIRPLLIFHGQGLPIKSRRKEQWDKKVTFHFQNNAWCDEVRMVTWIQKDWGSYFSNRSMPGSDGKLLIADIHLGQQRPKVKNYLRRYKTHLAFLVVLLAAFRC